MNRDLRERVAAAQAAHDADTPARCHWCAATDTDLIPAIAYGLGAFECRDTTACHARFLRAAKPEAPQDTTPDGREAPILGPRPRPTNEKGPDPWTN